MSSKNKVIIIGGGISGKLAARVLSDVYKEVIILERDSEPEGPTSRKGAPQGEHLHALLHAGEYGLEKLFPGITEKFYESGAVKINSTIDLAWFHHGAWKIRYDGGYSTTLQTRPHLEWHIEQYIKRIPNIKVRYNQVVQDFLYSEAENRIIGVQLKNDPLLADLVVDSSGVSSLTSNWLHKRGTHVPEEKVEINLSYISKQFQLDENQERDWKIKMIYPDPPKEKIGGTISKIEGNHYIVTIMGYHNAVNDKEVLKDDMCFIELSKKLPRLDIYQEIENAASLTKTSLYRIPHLVWRRIEKMKLPDGLLLIGDTFCRIDPVFGQGMSIAILEALALQKLIHKDTRQLVPAVFHKKAAKIIAPIWNMVLTEDFRYPDTHGKKPFGLSIQLWYAKNIFLLSAQNQEVYNAFVKVMNLVNPITSLMRPRIIKMVLNRTFTNARKP
ncbi:glutamate synthase subunit beta [Neobacillus sp. DY30]|uniref:NAD(P)/FAD-dependent oxidoreductase n=1 Tax=Neobacillus sp. DY30 TaxID=3047871 RepID=UPI0024BF5306|nr:glutamate synthase subunit beta [Neobacillus sp. DY30]WHX98387.1 glutamate synthase subunit beta [Neobacillus sp. DY30]